MIPQHHGTRTISFFYQQASERTTETVDAVAAERAPLVSISVRVNPSNILVAPGSVARTVEQSPFCREPNRR